MCCVELQPWDVQRNYSLMRATLESEISRESFIKICFVPPSFRHKQRPGLTRVSERLKCLLSPVLSRSSAANLQWLMVRRWCQEAKAALFLCSLSASRGCFLHQAFRSWPSASHHLICQPDGLTARAWSSCTHLQRQDATHLPRIPVPLLRTVQCVGSWCFLALLRVKLSYISV